MTAGLLTPLHLAASLLALFAALGLAVVVLARPGAGPPRRRVAPVLVALGALAIAGGHGVSGVLLAGTADGVAWARAGGLVLIAAGLSRPTLGISSAATAHGALASMAVVPVAPLPAAAVGGLAGAVAAVRAFAAGWHAVFVGLGLLAWSGAELATRVSPAVAAWLWLAGALALGGWLWQACASRLQAKFVTAFVAAVLLVVVLISAVLSGLGSAELVQEELRRLDGFSESLSVEISEWPAEAVDAGLPFVPAAERFFDIPPGEEEALASVYTAFFGTQDFFLLLGADGSPQNAYPPHLVSGSLEVAISGSATVETALAGEPAEGELMTVGGALVAVGGVQLPGEQPEQPPRGVLVTGRVLDEQWAAATAPPDVELIVQVGEQASASSPGVAPVADDVVDTLAPTTERGTLTLDGHTWYATASPIQDPRTGEVPARVVAMSTADVIAQLEQDQTRRLFLLAFVGALIAGAVAALVSGRLVGPIRRLTVAAAAVREGDLDTETAVDASDEVGELGRTFDEMTTSLAAQSAQLREAADVQGRLRARLEALTSSMGDALVAVDDDGKVITFNPAAEQLVRQDVAEVLGLPLEEVLQGTGPAGESAAEALGAAHSEEPRSARLLLQAGDDVVPTAATAAPVRGGDGEVLGRVLVLRDIAREAEIERMKTEFLSNVSHELRTPLTPIRGYADVLARRDVGPDATQRYASQILEATSRLERIVGIIVDFAALDSGRLQLRAEPLDVSDVVGEALREWRATHPGREFRRRVARGLPPIHADARMLRRCLDELVDNALKFSPGGQPVTVTACLDEGEEGVWLSVRDRGVGIDEETAARVFSDFYQVDASETRHYGGLGMGLAFVRRIVEGLGGAVAVDSDIGKGSTFHLFVLRADEDEVGGWE